MGTMLRFMGHWGFCWVAFGWVGRVEVLFLRWSWTSVSLKASVSRSVMVIALVQADWVCLGKRPHSLFPEIERQTASGNTCKNDCCPKPPLHP